MGTWNLYAAWIGIALGFASGAIQGLFFHREDWLGGYQSWERRMTRLGHISFFGLAFINLAFAATSKLYAIEGDLSLPSVLLIIGAVTMPLICYSSAFLKPLRHLFFIPVLSLMVGAGWFLAMVLPVQPMP